MSAEARRASAGGPLDRGRAGSAASGRPVLAAGLECRGRCDEAGEDGRTLGRRRHQRGPRAHERRRGTRRCAVSGVVATIVVLARARVVLRRRAMRFVAMRRGHGVRVRSRLLPTHRRRCRNPTQGQQHRQQHEHEDPQRLHGFEASTLAETHPKNVPARQDPAAVSRARVHRAQDPSTVTDGPTAVRGAGCAGARLRTATTRVLMANRLAAQTDRCHPGAGKRPHVDGRQGLSGRVRAA